MARPVAKERLALWVAGSRRARHLRGFTLLELLVVIAIIAMAAAGVSFAMPDHASTQLEREAHRLAALLESARAQSRARGEPVHWQAQPGGFHFAGLPPRALPRHWLEPDTRVMENTSLQLGPEPMIAPQHITLISQRQPGRAWRVSTDGLRPFRATPSAGQEDRS